MYINVYQSYELKKKMRWRGSTQRLSRMEYALDTRGSAPGMSALSCIAVLLADREVQGGRTTPNLCDKTLHTLLSLKRGGSTKQTA